MSNAVQALADKYALLKMAIEQLEEQLKPVKAELSSLAPQVGEKMDKGWKLAGDRFAITVSVQSRSSIVEQALIDKCGLSQAQIDACKKESVFDVIRYKAIA